MVSFINAVIDCYHAAIEGWTRGWAEMMAEERAKLEAERNSVS
jgi:hypothetical protein